MAEQSEYEKSRLANIQRNQQVLESLGLVQAKVAMRTPPPSARKPKQPREHEPVPDRHLRPRVSKFHGAASPSEPSAERSSRSDKGSDLENEQPELAQLSTPPKPARAPKPSKQRASPTFTPEQRRQLYNANKNLQWLKAIEDDFLRNTQAHLTFYSNACSNPNVNTVMRRLTQLAQGEGVEHPHNKGAPTFMAGKQLALDSDVSEWLASANAWLDKYGRDKSNGWLLTHPLRKLQSFQSYLANGRPNLAAHADS
jgi:hypothetical protein